MSMMLEDDAAALPVLWLLLLCSQRSLLWPILLLQGSKHAAETVAISLLLLLLLMLSASMVSVDGTGGDDGATMGTVGV